MVLNHPLTCPQVWRRTGSVEGCHTPPGLQAVYGNEREHYFHEAFVLASATVRAAATGLLLQLDDSRHETGTGTKHQHTMAKTVSVSQTATLHQATAWKTRRWLRPTDQLTISTCSATFKAGTPAAGKQHPQTHISPSPQKIHSQPVSLLTWVEKDSCQVQGQQLGWDGEGCAPLLLLLIPAHGCAHATRGRIQGAAWVRVDCTQP